MLYNIREEIKTEIVTDEEERGLVIHWKKMCCSCCDTYSTKSFEENKQ